MLEAWMWLAACPGVSHRTKYALLQHFGTPEAVYQAGPEGWKQAVEIRPEALAALEEYPFSQAQAIMSQCLRDGVGILTLEDAEYPIRLRNIYDPPILLFYKGTLPNFEIRPVIGIVGTRKASAYGLSIAQRMGREIAACGGMVVSGLAAGIDAAAMEGALSTDTPVIGVLGCGIDVVYPHSSRELYRRTEQCGCILTEFAPGTPPVRWNFPQRNRIISGISNGIVVVEAPERSGSLITASAAAEQGRDVFVVPGNVDVDGFVGSNRLLKDGAGAVLCGWDVMAEYESAYPDTVHKTAVTAPEPVPAQPEKVAQKPKLPAKQRQKTQPAAEKKIDNTAPAPYIDLSAPKPNLTEQERLILDCIGDEDRLVDDVVAQTGIPTGKVLGMLTILELKGVIARVPGKRVRRKAKP